MSAKNLVSIARTRLARFYDSDYYVNYCFTIDAVILAAASRLVGARPVTCRERPYSVVVLFSAGGNTGDEAMLCAFLDNLSTTQDVLLICQDASRFAGITDSASSESRIVVGYSIPGFGVSGAISRLVHTYRFARAVKHATDIGVVGADMVDGIYSPSGSVSRLSILNASARRGVPVALLGFSWSSGAPKNVTKALRRVSNMSNVNLYVRDPASYSRLQSLDIYPICRVADMAFSIDVGRAASISTLSCDAIPRNYCIVNVSGLIGARMGGGAVPEYSNLVNTIIESLDIDVVLVPHVDRQWDSDVAAQLEVASHLVDERRIQLVDRRVSVADALALVRSSRFVVTGRMHLGILALRCGVPAIILSTQGKVEGLEELMPGLVRSVRPEVGFGAKVAEVLLQPAFHHHASDPRIADSSALVDAAEGAARRNFSYSIVGNSLSGSVV